MNMQAILKQAQAMQKDMMKAKEEIDNKEFIGESMLLGGLGGIFGSVLGFIFAQQVSIHVFSSSITFQPLLIPITILVSVLVTGLSSLMPIRSATEVDPALVLKGE